MKVNGNLYLFSCLFGTNMPAANLTGNTQCERREFTMFEETYWTGPMDPAAGFRRDRHEVHMRSLDSTGLQRSLPELTANHRNFIYVNQFY